MYLSFCLLFIGKPFNIRSDAKRVDKSLNSTKLLEQMGCLKEKMLYSNTV
jgi:hypothetical protein